MLKLLNTSLRIAVAPDGLSLARTQRWGGESFSVLAELPLAAGELGAPDRLATNLHSLCDGHVSAGLALHVIVADELTRLWQVTPPQGAARRADLEAACALRFHSLFGESLAGWRMAADWSADSAFFAAAMPAPLFSAISQFAQSERLRLASVAPALVHAWNRWRGAVEQGAWFALVQGGRLSFCLHEAGRLSAVRSLPMSDGASLDWLQQHCVREALRLGVPAPSHIQACGQVPAAWTETAGGALRCTRLDHARRGLPALSGGAMLAMTGAAA